MPGRGRSSGGSEDVLDPWAAPDLDARWFCRVRHGSDDLRRPIDDGAGPVDDRRSHDPPAAPASTHCSATAAAGGDHPTKCSSPGECVGAAAEPPAGATGVQATFADIDADTRADVVWLYDAADGTHLHIRTGRGVADDIVLGYGKGSVAVGIAQVDLAAGTPDPGTAQEIVAVTSDGDGRRLVGVYGFALNTGCLETFVFDQGNPFVYLVNKNGNLSGLRCVSDGVTGHLEALTATPAGVDAFSTSRLVFGRIGRRLVAVSYETGNLPAPADAGVLASRQRRHRLLPVQPGLLIARCLPAGAGPGLLTRLSLPVGTLRACLIRAFCTDRARRSSQSHTSARSVQIWRSWTAPPNRSGEEPAQGWRRGSVAFEERDRPQAALQVVLHGPGGQHLHFVGHGRGRWPAHAQLAPEDPAQERQGPGPRRRPGGSSGRARPLVEVEGHERSSEPHARRLELGADPSCGQHLPVEGGHDQRLVARRRACGARPTSMRYSRGLARWSGAIRSTASSMGQARVRRSRSSRSGAEVVERLGLADDVELAPLVELQAPRG